MLISTMLSESNRTFIDLLHLPRFHIFLLILLGLAVYSNTFGVPFLLDDFIVVDDPRIRDLSNVPSIFVKFDGPIASRPFMTATFMLNYALGGTDTWGYHAFNIALHLLNGTLLYLLVLKTGLLKGYEEKLSANVAAFASLLFVVHPVQTETVTYVVSRSMLLATLFFLAGLNLYAAASVSNKSKLCYATAIFLVSLAGMSSRENFVTFPVMLVLYDLLFISNLDARKMMQRWLMLMPAFLSLAYLAVLVVNNTHGETAGFDVESTSPGEYFMTQFNVHMTYLRILLLPVNQNLDYDYPLVKTFFDFRTLVSFVGYGSLWAAGLLLVRKRPVIAFSLLWFMVTLVPSSSIMPIKDVIFEHRLYLPSAGFFVATCTVLFYVADKYMSPVPPIKNVLVFLLVVVTLAYGVAAYARNTVWSSGRSLWSDVVEKSPTKARGYTNLALSLWAAGETQEAITLLEKALFANPSSSKILSNLGAIYTDSGDLDRGIIYLEKAIRMGPNPHARFTLGYIMDKKKNYEEALKHFEAGLKIDPYSVQAVQARNYLGLLYLELGNTDAAIAHFEVLLEFAPHNLEAYINIASAYEKKNMPETARKYFEKAREISYGQ